MLKVPKKYSHEYVCCVPADLENKIMEEVRKAVSKLYLTGKEKDRAVTDASTEKICNLTDLIKINFVEDNKSNQARINFDRLPHGTEFYFTGRKQQQNNYSIREVLIMAWIQEKTKEEVEILRDKLLQSGKIKSAGKVEKYIYCRDRKTHEPIYHYQCECK